MALAQYKSQYNNVIIIIMIVSTMSLAFNDSIQLITDSLHSLTKLISQSTAKKYIKTCK